jgi:AraC-like DNA-binding protein
MDTQLIFDFLLTDTGLYPEQILKQHWTDGSWSYTSTPRPNHAIMLLLKGRIDFVTDAVTLSAKSGDLVFLPKGSHYDAVFHGTTEPIIDYLVNFDTPSEFLSIQKPTLLFEDASTQCAEYCEQLLQEELTDCHSPFHRKGLFFLFLDAVISMQKTENTSLQITLAKAQNLLNSNDDISIPEIARACCISESSLRRLFLEHLGISPVQYRLQSKLNRAMHLLHSTDMPIKEIAASLHFYDTAYFCKVFRSHVGMTPTQYLHNKRL